MSDLVGNPEDWFSRVAVHLLLEAESEETGLQVFRPLF